MCVKIEQDNRVIISIFILDLRQAFLNTRIFVKIEFGYLNTMKTNLITHVNQEPVTIFFLEQDE